MIIDLGRRCGKRRWRINEENWHAVPSVKLFGRRCHMGWGEVLKELRKSFANLLHEIPLWAKTILALGIFVVVAVGFTANLSQLIVYDVEIKARRVQDVTPAGGSIAVTLYMGARPMRVLPDAGITKDSAGNLDVSRTVEI